MNCGGTLVHNITHCMSDGCSIILLYTFNDLTESNFVALPIEYN